MTLVMLLWIGNCTLPVALQFLLLVQSSWYQISAEFLSVLPSEFWSVHHLIWCPPVAGLPENKQNMSKLITISERKQAIAGYFHFNSLWFGPVLRCVNPNLPNSLLRLFSVNLESITFMKVKIIVYQGKSYIIAKRNV